MVNVGVSWHFMFVIQLVHQDCQQYDFRLNGYESGITKYI